MLARAAGRSLRLYNTPAPAPIRVALPCFQSRHYAKYNKAKRAFEYREPSSSIPTNRHGPTAQRPDTLAAGNQASRSASDNTDRSSFPDISKLQVELNAIQRSRHSDQSSSSTLDSNPDYSTLQDEFQTSAPSDSNTAPQSSSPSAMDPAEAQRQHSDREPTRPLPDLTQGIPSTLDAEMASSAKADPASLNITEAPSQPGGQGGGDLPKIAYISSLERRRNRMMFWFYLTLLGGATVSTVFLGRNWESEEEELAHPDAPSGWGFKLFYNRAIARLSNTTSYYTEPAFPRLLPDTDPIWERPYTLVVSLEDMLVHSEWSREHGWRMAKRPGVDYFLRYLSQYYELVIFTSVPSMIAQPIIGKLDPYRMIMWPLFREATKYKDGEYIKDLSYLNRDLSKVILLDTNPAHAKLQPENTIIIPKWKGDRKDKDLVSYIPFLEYIGANINERGKGDVDTRAILKSFEGVHIPTEYERRIEKLRAQFNKQTEEERGKRPKRSAGFLGSLIGAKQQDGVEPSLSEGFEQGKILPDQIRERGLRGYEHIEREIRENGAKWLKEMEAEEKKAMEESMKGMKSSITNVFPFRRGGGREQQS